MERRKLLTGATAGATTALTGGVSFPAIAQQRIDAVMVSAWARDFPGIGTGAQRLAERITQMSGGRIRVQYFAADERVQAFDSFDEVSSGNAQMYHAVEYYWKGKHPGFAYFGSVPFGLTATEINAWVVFGGGQQLWDEIVDSLGAAAAAVFAESREHDDLARRIHDSFVRARSSLGGWSAVADQEYVRQRNRVLGL